MLANKKRHNEKLLAVKDLENGYGIEIRLKNV